MMVRTLRMSALCGFFALSSVLARGAWATTFVTSGQLTTDTSVVEVGFSVAASETDNFYTTSYAGGTNAVGGMTAGGGFDPVLTLYTGAGTYIADGGGADVCGNVNADSVTGLCNDAFFTASLTPGSYILAITEFPFYPLGDLPAGFYSSVDPAVISESCNGDTTPFLESDLAPCVARTGNFTANISPAASAVTPEPATWLLLVGPLGGVVYASRRRLA